MVGLSGGTPLRAYSDLAEPSYRVGDFANIADYCVAVEGLWFPAMSGKLTSFSPGRRRSARGGRGR